MSAICTEPSIKFDLGRKYDLFRYSKARSPWRIDDFTIAIESGKSLQMVTDIGSATPEREPRPTTRPADHAHASVA